MSNYAIYFDDSQIIYNNDNLYGINWIVRHH